MTRPAQAAIPPDGYPELAIPVNRILPRRGAAFGCDMSDTEMLAALDHLLDALVSRGANLLDLTDDSHEALELQQLLSTARLTIEVLDQPLCPATRARHLRMLRAAAAAACRNGGPRPHCS